MIENIKRQFVSYGNESTYRDDKKQIFDYLSILKHTTNQLVDAVNHIKEEYDIQIAELERRITALDDPTYHEAETDPYAEQRKWIGKLCWYKLCEGDVWKVGRLEELQENADAGYPFVFDGLCYKICEPVKPDDDIIFKE